MQNNKGYYNLKGKFVKGEKSNRYKAAELILQVFENFRVDNWAEFNEKYISLLCKCETPEIFKEVENILSFENYMIDVSQFELQTIMYLIKESVYNLLYCEAHIVKALDVPKMKKDFYHERVPMKSECKLQNKKFKYTYEDLKKVIEGMDVMNISPLFGVDHDGDISTEEMVRYLDVYGVSNIGLDDKEIILNKENSKKEEVKEMNKISTKTAGELIKSTITIKGNPEDIITFAKMVCWDREGFGEYKNRAYHFLDAEAELKSLTSASLENLFPLGDISEFMPGPAVNLIKYDRWGTSEDIIEIMDPIDGVFMSLIEDGGCEEITFNIMHEVPIFDTFAKIASIKEFENLSFEVESSNVTCKVTNGELEEITDGGEITSVLYSGKLCRTETYINLAHKAFVKTVGDVECSHGQNISEDDAKTVMSKIAVELELSTSIGKEKLKKISRMLTELIENKIISAADLYVLDNVLYDIYL